jgi:threonyl-tRNA synthetase
VVTTITTGQVLTCSRAVTNADYPALEKLSESAVKDKQKFERLVVSKEDLLKMFDVRSSIFSGRVPLSHQRQYNRYKKYLIETKIPDGTSTTVYRCGPMVDLCVGPHIPHTGKIKAFMVTKVGIVDKWLHCREP